MIAVVDYGVGNLFSLTCSLRYLHMDAAVTGDAGEIQRAEKLILPGVGAFGNAMDKLEKAGLLPALHAFRASGRPILGICLGMQLLFEKSYEYGTHAGLGWLPGEIRPLPQGENDLKVPEMGWNSLEVRRPEDPLMTYTEDGAYVYYVHSYYATACESSLVAGSRYGVFVPGVVHSGNVYGTQFHPEKSGEVGLNILRAFGEVAV